MPGLTASELAPFDDLEPYGYGTRLQSPGFVVGVELAAPLAVLGVLVASWLRRRRRAARAAAIEGSAAGAALVPGETVVRGVVADVDDGGDVAVRVTIVQEGAEQDNEGSWKTQWTETGRTTEARPFQLELADGRRLRVEPGAAPRLVDDLEPWEITGPKTRAASARLTRGETVFVGGEIATVKVAEAGYRGGEGPVLRAPRGRPMSLSTHGLAAPEQEAAERLARSARWVALSVLIAQLLALPYWVSAWSGETRPATVERRWEQEGKNDDNRVVKLFFVRYRLAGSDRSVDEQVNEKGYAMLAEGRVFPVRVSPLETTIGPHPTLNGMLVLPTMVALWLLLGLALYGGYRTSSWYERKLDELTDGRISPG
jgi:hypothetical protein